MTPVSTAVVKSLAVGVGLLVVVFVRTGFYLYNEGVTLALSLVITLLAFLYFHGAAKTAAQLVSKATDVKNEFRQTYENLQAGKTVGHPHAATGAQESTPNTDFDWETLIAKLKKAYPEIDEHSEKYSEALEKEVEQVQQMYMTKFDMSPSKALCAATAHVVGKARGGRG